MFIDGVALTLGILFVVLFLLGFSQLVQVLRSHDSNLSLRNAIVFLLTSSALLRSIFWLKTAFPLGMSNQVLMIVYFLPIWLDFSGLSGLAVFYANIINLSGPYRKYPGYISVAFNFCFLVIDLALASMLDDPSTSSKVKDELSNLYQVYSILLDFLLASLLLYFGYRFRQVGSEKISYMLPRSFRTFLYVNWLVVLCYTIRGICNCFFYANEVLPASMRYVYFSKTHPMTPLSVLLFFIFIELLPNACVIMLLWKVSDSKSYDNTMSYTYENIKNNLFSTDSSRDYLLSSSESPMYSNDKDSTDNSHSTSLHGGSIHVIYSDMANLKDNYYISPSQFHDNYKAESNSNSSSGDGTSSNNSNSSSPGKGYSRSLYDSENGYYPKISSRSNTPNSTGHALSPLKAAQQSHDDNYNNNNNDNNNDNNNNNNNNNNSRSNNFISTPSTINILNFSSVSSVLSGGAFVSEGSSPPKLVGPCMNSPGSESNNSIIWRQIQSNLGDGGRINSRVSMSAGSEDMLLNLEQGGLLGDAMSGGKLTTSMLYSAGDETSGTTPPLLSTSEGGTVTIAPPRQIIGSTTSATKMSDKNYLPDSNSSSILQPSDPTMMSPGRTGKGSKKQANKKEKYANTVSPRDILLMSIKEDP